MLLFSDEFSLYIQQLIQLGFIHFLGRLAMQQVKSVYLAILIFLIIYFLVIDQWYLVINSAHGNSKSNISD